ncbi:hypothetical protein KCV07_g7405, partial [Aureobasidium melanogenum]
MTLHLSFAFAVAFLSVSVISSAFNGPRATSAVDDEVSFAHGWTPRPTSGSVVRNIERQNARNVLTEFWAPDNVCGYYQSNYTSSWACPVPNTCMVSSKGTNTIGFVGCGTSGTVLGYVTTCVDFSQYLQSSSLYDPDNPIRLCTNSAMPYCKTVTFPDLTAEDYACESTYAYTTDTYHTDYIGDPKTRYWSDLEITMTSPMTSTTSTTSTSSSSSSSSTSSSSSSYSTSSSSSSTSVSSSSPPPVPTPSPTPKSHTGAIVGSVKPGWHGLTNRGMKRLEKEGCAWTKVCGEPDELLLWDLRTPDYNLSSITYQSRFCVYTCYMPVTETKLTEAMLPNCLNHVDSFRCNSYGPTTIRKDAVQVPSLAPLFAAWRTVWYVFPVDIFGEFAFHIELSTGSIEGACAASPNWRHCVPEAGGLAIPEGRVSQSILELATVMGVRSSKPVPFSLIGAEEYRRMHALEIPEGRDVFKGLEDVLQQLSTPKDHK